MKPVSHDASRLVRSHLPGVWAFLRYLGADHALADDLAQETFLVAFSKPIEQRAPEATSAWLRGVARNLYLTHRRTEGRRAALLEIRAAEQVWEHYIGDDKAGSFLAALHACLERLDERSRRALLMRFRDGLDGAQTAQALGVTESNLHSLVSRGRVTLRECIESRTKADDL